MTEGKYRALRKLKIIQGQIQGIINMLEEDRYCVDVATQILAVIGQLKSANLDVLDSHLKTCVSDAILEEEGEEKIDELMQVIQKYIR